MQYTTYVAPNFSLHGCFWTHTDHLYKHKENPKDLLSITLDIQYCLLPLLEDDTPFNKRSSQSSNSPNYIQTYSRARSQLEANHDGMLEKLASKSLVIIAKNDSISIEETTFYLFIHIDQRFPIFAMPQPISSSIVGRNIGMTY